MGSNPKLNRGGRPQLPFEDTLIAGLESLCSLFDNVYFAKSLGIISDQNFLYRHLNKGDWGSRLWFVTLLLSIRRCLSQLFRILQEKGRLRREFEILNSKENGLVNDVLKEKLSNLIQKSALMIRSLVFDLIQNVLYLVIVTVDVFKFKLPQKWRQILEPLSSFITFFRLFAVGPSTSLDV